MSTERHQRLFDLFRQACDCTPQERLEFLDKACGHDQALREEVQRLLAWDAADPSQDFLSEAWPHAARVPSQVGQATPERVGKYRILRVLGQGGMGVVYLAEQDNPKRHVAIKVVAPGLATPQMLSRFQLEADALARLQHPHIAQIYETDVADSPQGPQPYLAMEYVEGTSLLEHAERHQLDATARLELLRQLCNAVQHAHQKGVIHRDLKPTNILVTRDHQLKILDFGVARLTDTDLRATTLRTHVGDLLGTVQYMSPEQASGNSSALDTRSDVYALGVIGFELLSGQLPYDLGQRLIHEAVQIVQSQPPARLSSIIPALRGDVETIITKALEKEPSRRYQSASDMAEDIRRFLNDQPILARPPSVVYQLRKFAYRNALLVGGVTTVAVLIVVGLIGMSWMSWRLARERDRSVALRQQAEQSRDEALHAQREAEAARREAEQALLVQTAISGFLQDVFAAASPYVGRPDITVSEALDFAATRVDEKLAHLPEAAAAVRMRLADTLFSQGKLARAIEQMQAALKHAEAREPPVAADVVMIHATLGQLWQEAGNLDASGEHLRQALKLCEDPALKGNPARTLTLVNYAALLLREQQFEPALPLLQEALALRVEELGPDHPYTMTVRNNLAVATSRLGMLDEAEALSRENVASHRRALGDKHPNTITGIYNLADILRERGQFTESEELFRLCCSLGATHLPTRHFMLGQYHSGYGELLRHMRRYPEAEPELRLGYEILAEQLGEPHPSTIRALDRLIQMYDEWERPEQAEQWRAKHPNVKPGS